MRRHPEFFGVGALVGMTAAYLDNRGGLSDVGIWYLAITTAICLVCLFGMWWEEGRRR